MAYQRLQPTRALPIIPVDGLRLPGGPGSSLAFSTTTLVAAGKLIDGTATFTSTIRAGYTVYNLATGQGARVTGVDDANTLTLSDDIFTLLGEDYVIGSIVKGGGAVLWVSTGGSIAGETAGGDNIVLNNVPDGSLLPILMSVINQTGTTATGMYGLW